MRFELIIRLHCYGRKGFFNFEFTWKPKKMVCLEVFHPKSHFAKTLKFLFFLLTCMKGHFHLAQISTPIIWTLWECPMLLINMNSSGLPGNKRFTYALKSFQEKYDFYRAFAEWKWFPLKIETMFITNRISISSLTVVLHVIWHFNRTSIRPLKNGFLIRLGTVLEYSEFQSYWTIEFQNLLKLWFRIIPRVPSKVAFFWRISTQRRSVERSFQNIFCIFCILLIMEWYNIKYEDAIILL